MASRWRTWDVDFDAHSSKKPEETELIAAVGQGRGKPLKDVGSLILPKAALGITKEKNAAQAPATGRGRASVMKARALTDSPPVRRPGEKTAAAPTSLIDRLESFPPLSATNPAPSSPKWVKGQNKSRSSKKSITSQPASKSPADKPVANSMPPGLSIGMKEHLLSSSDGSDVIIIENFPSTINEKDLVDLFKPYGDVLACIIERDAKRISLGTSLIRMESRNACEWIVNTFSGEEYPGASEPMVCRFLTEDKEQ
ncbi:RNA-binding motif, single-stranded-interacting protein 1 [Desmophyllum pertusum]|uniref:RNA-binding motif, single-stranded-interacting protein 1 n=1 Tax=Desmophyllum pertusum TaxID=174260 RepID=A0A9W9YZW4_9CNID|nr:RNA-binding motif, single-stranded-interacting protein 1 [Desmophyllum pertusum]